MQLMQQEMQLQNSELRSKLQSQFRPKLDKHKSAINETVNNVTKLDDNGISNVSQFFQTLHTVADEYIKSPFLVDRLAKCFGKVGDVDYQQRYRSHDCMNGWSRHTHVSVLAVTHIYI